MNLYILDKDKNVVPATLKDWGEFTEYYPSTIVKQDDIEKKFISTVFLGTDSGFCNCERGKCKCLPIVFETMVFNKNDWDGIYCDRYSTWGDATKGHEKAVQWVKDGCKNEE